MAGEAGMPVYLAAAAAALFYVCAVPVRAGAAWRSGGRLRVGITIGPFRFSAHGDLKYAVGSGLAASFTHDASGRVHEMSLLRDAAARSTQTAALSGALKYLFRHVRPWKLKARMHISLQDAAATAVTTGLLRSALSAVRAARPGLPLDVSITSDFRSAGMKIDLLGILSCRLGHIMAAGLIWCRDYLIRRLHTWTSSNRSKAS